MKEVLSSGEISFEVSKDRVKLVVKGKHGADVNIADKGMIQASPIEDSFVLTVEEFMDLLFAIYGVEEVWKWNDDTRRIEVGRAKDYFIKFTNFAKEQRTIFYLKGNERERLMVRLETLKGQLREVRFRHFPGSVMVIYDWKELHFITENESDILYGQSLEIFKEIVRSGFTSETGFCSFGAGKISLNKPSGSTSIIGGKRWKDRTVTSTFYLAEGISIPKLTAKTYLAVR